MSAVAIRIPPGQAPSTCKLCGKTIYWGATSKGNPTPVSVNGKYLSDARPPMGDRAGAGIDHHIDCPELERQRAVVREQREREERVLREQTELPLFILSRNP